MSNSNQEKVSIIIVTYNGLSFLKKCLLTIKKQTYKNCEVVVVDNNSQDGTSDFLKNYWPHVIQIKNSTNSGFAKANNQGARAAKGTFLFFLNNDTELFLSTLSKLVSAYKPKSILTAYQIPTRNKKLPGRSGAGMDLFGYPFIDVKNHQKTKLFYADGAALFLKREDFVKIGMFDEKLFMFQEDVDLSWRAQIMGFKIIPCRAARLYHFYGGTALIKMNKSKQYISSYFRRYLNERNVLRNLLKNYSFPLVFFVVLVFLAFHFFEIVFFMLLRNMRAVKCYLASYWWNIKNIKDTLKLRNVVQNKRIVSDWKLLKKMYWTYSKIHVVLKIGIPQFQ